MNLFYILSIVLPPILAILCLILLLVLKNRVVKRVMAGLSVAAVVVTVIGVLYIVRPELFGKGLKTNADPYVTDPAGTSYLAVELGDGAIYAAVTDADGKIYAAKIQEDGSIGERVADIGDQVEMKDLPKNYTGAPVEDSQDAAAYKGSVAQTDPTQTTTAAPTTAAPTTAAPTTDAPTDPTASTASVIAPIVTTEPTTAVPTTVPTTEPVRKTHKVDKYRTLFESGQYLIEFTTDEEALGDTPVTAAVKNGNLMMTASIENWDVKMIYRAADDKTYLLIPTIKKYLLVPENVMGEDLDMSEMVSDFTIEGDDAQIETSQVTINGVPLVCETVTGADGKKTQYYFDGDTLVRMDSEQDDGTVERTYISRISSDVPDELFDIPTGYAFLNLPLDKLMG